MAARLIAASPVERSAAARAFVLLATAIAVAGTMIWAHDLAVPPAALALAAAGHWYSLRHLDRIPTAVQVLVGLAVLACFASFVADSLYAVLGGQLPQVHLTLLIVAATSFVLRTRRNLYSSLWLTLAALYLASVFAWDHLFAVAVGCWLACLAGFWAATHLAGLGARGLRLPGAPLAVAAGGVLVLGTAAFVLVPLPETRPPAGITISLPGAPRFQGELEQPALSLVQVTGGQPGLDLRYRGRLGEDVVLVVRTAVPALWRGQVFDRYRGGAWSTSRQESQTLPGSIEPGHLPAPPGPQRGVFSQVFQVIRPLPGAIVVAEPVQSLHYPAPRLRRDLYGTWRAPGTVWPGTTYSAVSYLPDLTPASLRAARAGAGVEPAYLDATGLSSRALALAVRVAGGERDPYDRAMALTTHLQASYRYTLAVGRVPPGQDPVDRFLFDDRAGYCEQFATAEVLMLRGLGIPARLATGYAPGEHVPLLRQAIVRERDAHAWVEAWFPGHGWVPLDPSPGFPALGAAGPAGRWLVPGLAAALPRLSLSAAAGALGSPGLATMAAAATATAAAVALAVLLVRRRRAAARPRRAAAPELLTVYERLQRRLARRRAPPETPNEYRGAVGAGELEGLLSEVTDAVNRGAYAGRWPSRAELDDLRRRLG